MTETAVRIDFTNHVFEARGSRKDVDDYLQRYADLIQEFRTGGLTRNEPSSRALEAQPTTAMPTEFGEYFHQFGNDVTDVDRVLIAGHFAQLSNGRSSFSTREANELLLNQGVKVANASECVRRTLSTRRVFGVGKGEYKVSSQGAEHLRMLMKGIAA